MEDYIYSISNLKLFILVNAVIVGFSLLFTLTIRKVVPPQKLFNVNSGFSRVDTVLSQIYAVIVAFSIYGLFNAFHDAKFSLYHEANTLDNIAIYSKDLPKPLYNIMAQEVRRYAHAAIYSDWDAMSRGKPIHKETELIIQKMKLSLYEYPASSRIEKNIISNILEELKSLESDRDKRVRLSNSSLPNEFFFVIILISIFLIASSFINENTLFFHLSSSMFISFAIASTLFLLLILDRPFRGSLSVKPVEFQKMLENMGEP